MGVVGPAGGEQFDRMGDVVVAKEQRFGPGEPRAGVEAGVGQLVDQDQILRSSQRRDDAEIGEIAGAKDAGRLGSLDGGEAGFELAEERMVAGDEARGAGARAIAFDGGDGGGLDGRMMGEAEIVVAGEGDEAAAVADDMEAVGPVGRLQRAAQMRGLKLGEFCGGEGVEGSDQIVCLQLVSWRALDRARQGLLLSLLLLNSSLAMK